MSPASQIYAKITGPIVMVGFGSIGKGTLPMIERHLDYDKSRVTVIDPKDEGRKAHCEKHNVRFIQQGVTKDNYRELADPAAHLKAAARVFASISRSIPALPTSWSSATNLARSISTPSTSPGSASISILRRARKRAPTTRFAK
jgi:hypothetical protein